MTAAEPRLALKTAPPRLSRQLLERPRLSFSALHLEDRPVLRIEAPAGFGKTCLLSQWRRELLDAGIFVAWLTVDEDDDTPARFVQALSYAMEQTTGRAAFARIRKREATTRQDRDRLTEWLAEVGNLAADCVLLLDEMEHLPAAVAKEVIPYLLSNIPPNLKVVLASRTRPDARLSDPDGHRLPAVFSANALRFTLPETIATLQSRFGARADADVAEHIHEVTEGWPLGLQLVVSAMTHGMSAQETLDLMVARSGDLRRQFVNSLLAHLPPEMGDFLVRISIVERIHPDLCAALTGRLDVQEVLERLQETTPLLASDLDGPWLRLHGLVREFLQERFAALPVAQRRAAHAAAAAWLESNGLLEEAARHAHEAGQAHWAWEMAERSLLGMLESAQIAEVQAWLARSPLPEKEQQPRLLVTAGWSCVLNGRPDEAEGFAARALADVRASGYEKMRANVVLSACAIFRDLPERAAALMSRWRDMLLADPAMDRFNGFNQLAWLALHQGNVAEARRILGQHQLGDDSPFIVHAVRGMMWSIVYIWEGRVPLAVEAVGRMLERMDQESGRRSGVSVSLAGPLAYALVEDGAIEEAEAVLAGRLDVLEQLGQPTSVILGYVAASRVACLRGDHPRAHELLESLIAGGERRRLPRAQCVAMKVLVEQHALLGNAAACTSLLQRFEGLMASEPVQAAGMFGGLIELYFQLAAAWAARARRDWTEVLAATEPANTLANRLNRGREVLEIMSLQALAQDALGQDSQFLRQQAVNLAASLGLKRIPGEAEPVILRPDDRPRERTQSAAPRVAPTPLLTPKEQRILSLLAQRLSNKQIAERLDISLTTIKWHLRNAYSKLNAGSRKHAVQRARMLGILDPV